MILNRTPLYILILVCLWKSKKAMMIEIYIDTQKILWHFKIQKEHKSFIIKWIINEIIENWTLNLQVTKADFSLEVYASREQVKDFNYSNFFTFFVNLNLKMT